MQRRIYLAVMSVSVLVVVGVPVYAGTITDFTSRPLFNAAVSGPLTVEDFTASSHFPIPSGVLNSSTNLPGISLFAGDIKPGVTYSVPMTAAPSGFFFNIDTSGGFSGGFLDGLRGNDPHSTLTTTFDNPVSGFGFDTNNLMGTSFDLTLKFSSGPDFMATVANPDGSNLLRFFGFVSSAPDILSAEITGSSASIDFALDNFTFTGVVPEPTALALVSLVGILSLGVVRQKSHTSN